MDALSALDDVKFKTHHLSKSNETQPFSGFELFPQPLLIINRELLLHNYNEAAKEVISDNWIRLNDGKIDFLSRKNNSYVCTILQKSLKTPNQTERFILIGANMVSRSYTVTKLENEFFLLLIHDYLNKQHLIQPVAQVFALSQSETKIANLMIEGLKPKEIAYETKLSLNTVRSHLRTLYAKMHVRDYNEALILLMRLIC